MFHWGEKRSENVELNKAMQKKTVVIISLVSAVISLLVMLFSYYGITRYISMHTGKVEKYSKNYTKLDKASDENRVVVSFSTPPEKVEKLRPFVNSLLDQTVKVDEIAFNLPEGVDYNIPDNLKNVMIVHKAGKDYGEGNSSVPTLIRENDANTQIVVVEANRVYGKDFIEDILDQLKKHPGKSLHGDGWILVEVDNVSPDVVDNHDLRSSLNGGMEKGKYKENYKVWGF